LSDPLLIPALVLALNGAAALVRLERGPTAVDRMLVAQLVGTLGVALILLLGAASGSRALLLVALVTALLAAVSGVAFVRRYLPWRGDGDA
jgi:multicomponent Na+:H+ antiporter subunit F